MAYVIEYEGKISERFVHQTSRAVKPKRLFLLAFTVILICVWVITPVRVAVLDFVLPGDGAFTRRAAGNMFQQMKEGQSFREAFSDFCIEIFENA